MDTTRPRNLLLENIEYLVEETSWGTWRRYVYPDGNRFAEYKSHQTWAGVSLVHYTFGRCPETGKRVVARGVIAVGRIARGMISFGQVAIGLVAFGQLSIGLVFGLGQLAIGGMVIGQGALGIVFAIGQFAGAYVAIGQFAAGTYALGQFAWGEHVVDIRSADPVAKGFFLKLIGR